MGLFPSSLWSSWKRSTGKEVTVMMVPITRPERLAGRSLGPV